MAIGVTNLNPASLTGNVTVIGSARSYKVTTILDSSATANTAGELLAPLSITNSNNVAVVVGPSCTGIMVRGKYSSNIVSGTHCGVVRLYSVLGEPTRNADGTYSFTNTQATPFYRIDSNTSGASGVTLSINNAGDVLDGSGFQYTSLASFGLLNTLDMLGGWTLITALETASDVDSNGKPVSVEVIVVS